MHMTSQELRRRLEAARRAQAGSAQRIQAHQELAEQCPAFVPNLLALSRSLQLDSREEADAQAHFAEAEVLFAEAARRASKLLEEAWAGWIGVLAEQEKLDAALELASRAQRVFPDSELIAEAVEHAKRGVAP